MIAVTCHFNPCGYSSLAENYWRFRENFPLPLVTVELSFNGEFAIPDALHIAGNEDNLMWQKERLLNVGIESLPDDCDKVAWVDADLLWQNPNWVEETEEKLDTYKVVQLFDKVEYLDSYGKVFRSNVSRCTGSDTGAPGGAWAARREALACGLNDTHVVGSGDFLMALAIEGTFYHPILHKMNPAWRRSYLGWACEAWDLVQGSIGGVSGTVRHLYHGSHKDRNYVDRWKKLTDHDYNPVTDIELDDNGLWRWASDKPEMHKQVASYFPERKEDEASGDKPRQLSLIEIARGRKS